MLVSVPVITKSFVVTVELLLGEVMVIIGGVRPSKLLSASHPTRKTVIDSMPITFLALMDGELGCP